MSLKLTVIYIVGILFYETGRAEVDITRRTLPSHTADFIGPAILSIANNARMFYSNGVIVHNLYPEM